MKYLLILLVLFSGCSKETNTPSTEISSVHKEPFAPKTNSEMEKILADSSAGKQSNKSPGYVKFGIHKLPPDIEYSGSIVAMAQWVDMVGSNILFVTETVENSDEDTRSKELYGYHFINGESGNKRIWKINDFVKDCPVDLTLDYIDKSLTITDLDKNGIAESTFLYKLSCKGDVSPDDMKLIMHENEKKYALRGSMNLIMNGLDLEKGSMKTDSLFDNAPDEFLVFAKGQWDKFKTEKIGD